MALHAEARPARWGAVSGRDLDKSFYALATSLYIGGIIVIGATLLIMLAPREYQNPYLALGLLAAALALSVFKLRLPLANGVSTMTLAYAVDFLALLLASVDLAMVIAAVGVWMQCTVRVRKTQPVYRTTFSIASVVIAVQAAGWTWSVFGGTVAQPGVIATLLPLSAAAVTYFAVNTALVAVAIALTSSASVARSWNREFLWSAPSYFLSAVVAGMIAIIMQHDAYLLVPLAASPLYISYRAYQMSVRRIEEERRHAQELAAMVATTQETLARAVQSEAALEAEKEELAITTQRLAVTLRTIRDGVVTVDTTGSVMLMNQAAQAFTALSGRDVTERPMGGVFAALGFSPDVYEAAMRCVLSEGQSVQLRNDTAGCEHTARLVEVTGTPTRDGDGHLAGGVWVIRDVSDAARLEHERSKAARLESLGVLAGGLAHDFNNILIGVVGNLSLAQTMVRPGDEGLKARLTHAEAACVRARGVTNQLLTFAKGGAPVKTTASVRDLVVECTRFALSGSSVAPRFGISPDVWPADVDTVQIGQVVHNLVLNAMQAMPGGGIVDVMVQNAELDENGLVGGAALLPGRYVRVTVQDRGPGIGADDLSHIFEPYFTTKEKGSGLGLAISYSIVKAHGGALTVESEEGCGSRFSFYLPASTRCLTAEAPNRVEVARRRSGHVLLMDDDGEVAAVARDMLESLGYVARVASSGRDAIEQFRKAEGTEEAFDVVILDLTVPGGMGGREAVTHIRNIRPEVPVVVTSGYADDSVLARFNEYGFDGVLPKPFGIPDLRRALEHAETTANESRRLSRPVEEAQAVQADARALAAAPGLPLSCSVMSPL